jgi:hypothetical protein
MKNSLSEVVPLIALKDLIDVIIPQDIEEINSIELSIRIEDFEVNIRELTTFLSFIDKVYGRMKDWSLNSYSHLPNHQLKIETIRFGSIEVIISEILVQAKENLIPLVVVFIALKVLKPLSEIIRSSAESYKLVVEAKNYLVKKSKIKLMLENY